MSKVKKIYLYMCVSVCFWRQTSYLTHRRIKNRLWKKKFYSLVKSEDARCEELLKEFLTCEMEKISSNTIRRKNKYSPILICVIKNDYRKIHNFMVHYRKLGVETFIFLDNCSTDGTVEYLCKQKDTIVYTSSQEYTSARRVAWINRLLAIYGENRWCLVVDSDELVTFIGSETKGFDTVIKRAIENHYRRIEGFLLDMYSEECLFKLEDENYVDKMCWFDKDSYDLHIKKQGLVISGGPRKRIFKGKEQVLSKYPLFYFGQDDFVASSHYMVPSIPKNETPILLAICHYKFSDDKDLDKIKEAVLKENYAGKSIDYKRYLECIKKNENINFFNPLISVRLNSSEDLRKIKFMRSLDLEV